MGTILVIVGGIVGVGILLNVISDKGTKLFRRVWSTERMGGSYADEEQNEAINQLIARYQIKQVEDREEMRRSVMGLLAAAANFDLKNPNNFGVEVAPLIARALQLRFPTIAD
jgi:hypothetical protein